MLNDILGIHFEQILFFSLFTSCHLLKGRDKNLFLLNLYLLLKYSIAKNIKYFSSTAPIVQSS